MKDEQARRFIYNAQAMAAGGWLQRPADELIPTQAAISLPITGGSGSSRVGFFRHRDIVSFRSAHSYVSGRQSPSGHFDTLATSVVEGLNISDVVTADRVVARVAAMHSGEDNTEPEITITGSHFEGLRINGHPVQFKWFPDHCAIPHKYDDLIAGLPQFPQKEEGDKVEAEEVKQARADIAGQIERQIIQPVEGWCKRGLLPISLITDLRVGELQCQGGQHFIDIPQFGSVYLGELIVSQKTRRLTMLRVELGCPGEGSMAFGSVEGDGHRP